jgi:hypothetical protein
MKALLFSLVLIAQSALALDTMYNFCESERHDLIPELSSKFYTQSTCFKSTAKYYEMANHRSSDFCTYQWGPKAQLQFDLGPMRQRDAILARAVMTGPTGNYLKTKEECNAYRQERLDIAMKDSNMPYEELTGRALVLDIGFLSGITAVNFKTFRIFCNTKRMCGIPFWDYINSRMENQ